VCFAITGEKQDKETGNGAACVQKRGHFGNKF
jgi:hypothetical protein